MPENYLAIVRAAEAEFHDGWLGGDLEPRYGPGPWSIHHLRDSLRDSVIYPPVGFVPLSELTDGDMGNGDYYGFYWPLGREDCDPLVARISHDMGTVIPIASSLESACRLGFLPGLDRSLGVTPRTFNERRPPGDETDLAERLAVDPDSPLLLVANADVHLAKGDLDRAAALYEGALARFPEYTAAHIGLAVLYRRRRMPHVAYRWMREALVSPIAFWGNSWWAEDYLSPARVDRNDYRKTFLFRLKQARLDHTGGLVDDPFFAARDRLSFASGVAANEDYSIYDELIDRSIASGRALDAVKLAMLYGELMMSETVSFRERYGFTDEAQRSRLLKTFLAAGLHDRIELLDEAGGRSQEIG